MVVYKKTDQWFIEGQPLTTSDNELYNEWQQMTTTDNDLTWMKANKKERF